jgi:hypothetical protein
MAVEAGRIGYLRRGALLAGETNKKASLPLPDPEYRVTVNVTVAWTDAAVKGLLLRRRGHAVARLSAERESYRACIPFCVMCLTPAWWIAAVLAILGMAGQVA